MSHLELSAFKGDDVDIDITVTDSSDNAIDITGWTIWFTAKNKATDDDSDAVIGPKSVTSHTDAANGESKIQLTNSDMDVDSGSYEYDIQTDDGSGNITTWGKGRFRVKEDVTETTS